MIAYMVTKWKRNGISPCLDYPSPMKTFIASLLALLAVTPQRTLDEFFNDFTARWVRNNPNLAVSSRYTGDERDRLEQQLAPETMEYKKSRILV